ncbi:hypothetical protein BH23CHL2_BH23CHL2_18100 [soil metagenome]
MDGEERAKLARKALAGYVHGPNAPIQATALALKKAETSRAVILVEGISDQIAIETLAIRRGRDLDAEGVAVLPIGGAQAITRYAREFGPIGRQLVLAGLCDADAAETLRRGLVRSGIGNPQTTADMARLGFHICIKDLEDELIRAVGTKEVQATIEAQGELGAFHTFQNQPEWREQPLHDQLHRFLRIKARRSLRYARLLVEAVEFSRVPHPLDAVLAHAQTAIPARRTGQHRG